MADVKLNDKQWNSLSDAEKKKITEMMRQLKIIEKNDSFVSDSATHATTAVLTNPFCTAACDVAEGAAVAACAVFTGPAFAVCVAAAHAAGDLCRSRC